MSAHPWCPKYWLELESHDPSGDFYLSLNPPYDHQMLVDFLLGHRKVETKVIYLGEFTPEEGI